MLERIDHLVLTVADIPRTVDFYQRVLGMRHEVFGEGRSALAFGQQKLNLHQAGREFEPRPRTRCRGPSTCAWSPPGPWSACWPTWPPKAWPWRRGRCAAPAPSGPSSRCTFATRTAT